MSSQFEAESLTVFGRCPLASGRLSYPPGPTLRVCVSVAVFQSTEPPRSVSERRVPKPLDKRDPEAVGFAKCFVGGLAHQAQTTTHVPTNVGCVALPPKATRPTKHDFL